MSILESWQIPRKAWIIIISQSTVILFLSSWLLNEYENNPFMQQYLTNLAPTIVPILSLAFGTIAAMTATTLYLRFRRVKAENDRLDTIPRSLQARRTPRKRISPRQSTIKPRDDQQAGLPIPRFIITETQPSPVAEEKKPDSPTITIEKQPDSSPSTTPTREPEVKPHQ